MKDSVFHNAALSSPAYVYDQSVISAVLNRLQSLKRETGILPLYSIKSLNMAGLLSYIQPHLSGFSCSSLFEVQLAKEFLSDRQTIHVTTPGYRDDEWEQLIRQADYITVNSIRQWQRFAGKINDASSCGIRINPDLSFVQDKRYDPCRPASKLGITFTQLADALRQRSIDLDIIEGVHLHSNCDSSHFRELYDTVERLVEGLAEYPFQLSWMNLGGGYLFDDGVDLMPLYKAIEYIKSRYGVTVFIEPGKAVTGSAGYLVATVIDLIEHKDKQVAVLDTSINHLPEVFEYQYQPAVMGATDKGGYEYRLAGCSCLSGDLFGDYRFNEKLETGHRIVFENVGAYMQVKANMFNGINLPSSYLFDGEKEFSLIKQYDYQSFRSQL